MGRITQPDSTITLRQRRVKDSSLAIKSGLEKDAQFQFIDTGSMVPWDAAARDAWINSHGHFFSVIALPRNQTGTSLFQGVCRPSWSKGYVGLFLGLALDNPPEPGDIIRLDIVGSVMDDVAFADLERSPTLRAASQRRILGVWRELWDLSFDVVLLDEGFTDVNEIYLTDILISQDVINHYSTIFQVAVTRDNSIGSPDNYIGVVGLSVAGFFHYPEYE